MFVILKMFFEFKIDCYLQNGFTKQSIHRHARCDTISIKINHHLMRFDSNLIFRDRTSSRWNILAFLVLLDQIHRIPTLHRFPLFFRELQQLSTSWASICCLGLFNPSCWVLFCVVLWFCCFFHMHLNTTQMILFMLSRCLLAMRFIQVHLTSDNCSAD